MSVTASRAQTLLGPKELFFRYFQQEATALQDQMARLANIPTIGGERLDATDHCMSGIARLQKEVQDASSYVPAYDQRIYGQAIKALNEKLEETKASFAPRSKFSFKTAHKNPSAISLSDAAELASQQQAKLPGYPPNIASDQSSYVNTPACTESAPSDSSNRLSELTRKETGGALLTNAGRRGPPESGIVRRDHEDASIRRPSFANSKSVDISSHTDLHVILPLTAAHATSSGSLANIKRCVIDMFIPISNDRALAALTVNAVEQSLLICGNVSGAAHITGVEDSVIIITTRQFRMHECRDCVVYLHVTSQPIIEDCHGIQFAPLPQTYENEPSNVTGTNKWDQVQDFKWLKTAKSPNWSILEAKDFVREEVWKTIATKESEMSLRDILEASGVTKTN